MLGLVRQKQKVETYRTCKNHGEVLRPCKKGANDVHFASIKRETFIHLPYWRVIDHIYSVYFSITAIIWFYNTQLNFVGLHFYTVRPMFIIASSNCQVVLLDKLLYGQSDGSASDQLRATMHFLCYSYCANEQPPDGAQKKSSVLFFHIHLIKWTVHEESLFSCCFSSSMSCVFLPEERWRGRTVVLCCFSLTP